MYGDLQIFDIIIFAGIAAFLVFRLKNVLGKRTGFEKTQKTNISENPPQKNPEQSIPKLPDNFKEFHIELPPFFGIWIKTKLYFGKKIAKLKKPQKIIIMHNMDLSYLKKY